MHAWTCRLAALSAVTASIAGLIACTSLDDLTAPDCAYTVAPMSIDMGSQGGTGTLAVRTPGVCPWTVESSAGWVTVSSDRSGNGDGNLGYAVAAHEGYDYRYAILTVAGKSVTVAQQGKPLPPPPPPPPPPPAPTPNCTFSVSPTSATFGKNGGTGTITVTAQTGCAWTATTSAGWITITAGATGSGNGQVRYSVPDCGCNTDRTGTISVAGRTVTITQRH